MPLLSENHEIVFHAAFTDELEKLSGLKEMLSRMTGKATAAEAKVVRAAPVKSLNTPIAAAMQERYGGRAKALADAAMTDKNRLRNPGGKVDFSSYGADGVSRK